MPISVRESILEGAKIEITTVEDVAHWGTLYVRPYPETLRILRRDALAKGTTDPNWRVQRMIDLLCEADGSPCFKQNDLPTLAGLDSRKLDSVSLAISTVLEEHEKKNHQELSASEDCSSDNPN